MRELSRSLLSAKGIFSHKLLLAELERPQSSAGTVNGGGAAKRISIGPLSALNKVAKTKQATIRGLLLL